VAIIDEMKSALEAAHAAGDTASVKTLINEIEKAEQFESPRNMLRTGLGGAIEGAIPIAGPYIRSGADRIAAMKRAALDKNINYTDALAQITDENQRMKEINPGIDLIGNLAGGTVGLGAVGATKVGASALGLTGRNIGTRTLKSAATTGTMAAGDTAARGGDAEDAGWSGAIGTGIGALMPGFGVAGGALVRAATDKIINPIRAAINPVKEASRRVGAAQTLDDAAGHVLSPDDIKAAGVNQQPVVNADRGGEHVRSLARVSANHDPGARETVSYITSDRFGEQGERVIRFFKRITGGHVDDIATLDTLKATAKRANKPAYDKAYDADAAQGMWGDEYVDLMRAPAFREAVSGAEKRAANRSATEGFIPPKNPFVIDEAGEYTLKKAADGSTMVPNLRFWDQVQRNLSDDIGAAQRVGNKQLSSDLIALKSKLVNSLDTAVPDFKSARQGAAKFFGAEDALEAGAAFAKSNRMLPEYKAGMVAMSKEERALFKVGYASEMIDMAKNVSDRTDLIRRFKSPEMREKMVMAFGKPKARELEAFIRVETAMTELKNAMGNSTTVRQAIEAGVVGGSAYWYTGDFNTGVATAAATYGARSLGKKIDTNVMKETARLLMSSNPKLLEKAVRQAALSPQHMAAVDAVLMIASAATRSGALAASRAGDDPLKVNLPLGRDNTSGEFFIKPGVQQ